MPKRVKKPNLTTPPPIATPKVVDASAEDVATPVALGAVKAQFDSYKADLNRYRAELDRTNNFMHLVVVVLFVGFFTLGFMLATILIQWWTFNANTQLEFTKSINQETQNLNQLNGTIDKLNTTLQNKP